MKGIKCLGPVIGLLMLVLGGCQYQGVSPWEVLGLDLDLNQGRRAFFKEDYGLAHRCFSRVLARERDSASAQLGLACVAVMGAKDTPILVKTLAALVELESRTRVARANTPMVVRALARGGQGLMTALEKEQGLNAAQAKKIKHLDQRARLLQYQISVLERIDQSLQKKRRP